MLIFVYLALASSQRYGPVPSAVWLLQVPGRLRANAADPRGNARGAPLQRKRRSRADPRPRPDRDRTGVLGRTRLARHDLGDPLEAYAVAEQDARGRICFALAGWLQAIADLPRYLRECAIEDPRREGKTGCSGAEAVSSSIVGLAAGLPACNAPSAIASREAVNPAGITIVRYSLPTSIRRSIAARPPARSDSRLATARKPVSPDAKRTQKAMNASGSLRLAESSTVSPASDQPMPVITKPEPIL